MYVKLDHACYLVLVGIINQSTTSTAPKGAVLYFSVLPYDFMNF